MFYIVTSIVILVALILLILDILYLKFQFQLKKENEANKQINIFLEKKLKLLSEVKPLIEKEISKKEILEDVESINKEELNTLEVNDILNECYNQLKKILEDNEKLYKSKKIKELIEKLEANEIDLYSTIKFYNDTLVVYNKLVKSFPSNIISILFKYKEKKYYTQKRQSNLEILKNEEK